MSFMIQNAVRLYGAITLKNRSIESEVIAVVCPVASVTTAVGEFAMPWGWPVPVPITASSARHEPGYLVDERGQDLARTYP